MKRSFFRLLLWALGYYKDPEVIVPKDFIFPNSDDQVDEAIPKVTWLGHSTFLIEAFGFHFLTDPIWKKKITPFGPKRRENPPLNLESLPPIDYVLISHDHYDHLDTETQIYLSFSNPDLQWIVPRGVKKWFEKHLNKKDSVTELDWGDSAVDHKSTCFVKFTSTYAKHFSGRTMWNYNKSLWMGIVVELRTISAVKRFYFAGDTGYDSLGFQEIGKHFKKIDLSLLPIGAYSPREFMRPVHVNPQEAIQIHKDVCSQLSIAGHFGTYKLSSEKMNQPPYELYLGLKERQISPFQFRVLRPGQTINW